MGGWPGEFYYIGDNRSNHYDAHKHLHPHPDRRSTPSRSPTKSPPYSPSSSRALQPQQQFYRIKIPAESNTGQKTSERIRDLEELVLSEKASLLELKNRILSKTFVTGTPQSRNSSTFSSTPYRHHQNRSYRPYQQSGFSAASVDHEVKPARWLLNGHLEAEFLKCDSLPRNETLDTEPDTCIEVRLIKVPPEPSDHGFHTENQTVLSKPSGLPVQGTTSIVYGSQSPSFSNAAVNFISLPIANLEATNHQALVVVLDVAPTCKRVIGYVNVPMTALANPHQCIRIPTGFRLNPFIGEYPGALQSLSFRRISKTFLHMDLRLNLTPKVPGCRVPPLTNFPTPSDFQYSTFSRSFRSLQKPPSSLSGGERGLLGDLSPISPPSHDSESRRELTVKPSSYHDPFQHHYHCVKCGKLGPPHDSKARCAATSRSKTDQCSVCVTLTSVPPLPSPRVSPKSVSPKSFERSPSTSVERGCRSSKKTLDSEAVAHRLCIVVESCHWHSKEERCCIVEGRVMRKPVGKYLKRLLDDPESRVEIENLLTVAKSVDRSNLQNGINGTIKPQHAFCVTISKAEVARLKVHSAGMLLFVLRLVEFDIRGVDTFLGDGSVTLSSLAMKRKQPLQLFRMNTLWNPTNNTTPPIGEASIVLESIV